MKTIIRTPETHPLTWRLRDDKQPVWLEEYQSKNGYAGARKALTGLAPDEIVNQVKDAGLKVTKPIELFSLSFAVIICLPSISV